MMATAWSNMGRSSGGTGVWRPKQGGGTNKRLSEGEGLERMRVGSRYTVLRVRCSCGEEGILQRALLLWR